MPSIASNASVRVISNAPSFFKCYLRFVALLSQERLTVSYTSAPEFGELLGKGFALGVTRLSGGPALRQIHHFHATAEYALRDAIREDGFDPAAACA